MAEETKKEDQVAEGTQTLELSDFENLLEEEFRPKSETANVAIHQAVKTLAAQALEKADIITDDVIHSIEGFIAELDKYLRISLKS